MSETHQQTIARIGANQIAKCIAKGTVGGFYVPATQAKKAFPKADHGFYDEAIEAIDKMGFIRWHKGGSCLALNPDTLPQAIKYALAYADEKRRAVLLARSSEPIGVSNTPQAQDWDDDEEVVEHDRVAHLSDLEAFVTRHTLDMRLAALPLGGGRDDEAFRGEVARLRADNQELKTEVGRLRAAVAEQEAGIQMMRDAARKSEKTLADLANNAEFIGQFVSDMKKRIKDKETLRGRPCNVGGCNAPPVKPIPVYDTNGFEWRKAPTEVAVCEHHSNHGYALFFSNRVLPKNFPRLMARLPKLPGHPLLVGPRRIGQAICDDLVRRGWLKEEETNLIAAFDRDDDQHSGPTLLITVDEADDGDKADPED